MVPSFSLKSDLTSCIKEVSKAVNLNWINNAYLNQIVAQFPDTQIFSIRYPASCKVYTGYHATSKIRHVLSACTADNPLNKARGLFLRTGGQPFSIFNADNNLVFLLYEVFTDCPLDFTPTFLVYASVVYAIFMHSDAEGTKRLNQSVDRHLYIS